MDANPRRFLLTEELQRDVASHGETFVSMTVTDARVIFPKSTIQHPMQAVFHSPMASDSVSIGVHRREREQKGACVSTRFLSHPLLCSNHSTSSQSIPRVLWVTMREDLAVTDGPVLSDLQPLVAFLDATL